MWITARISCVYIDCPWVVWSNLSTWSQQEIKQRTRSSLVLCSCHYFFPAMMTWSVLWLDSVWHPWRNSIADRDVAIFVCVGWLSSSLDIKRRRPTPRMCLCARKRISVELEGYARISEGSHQRKPGDEPVAESIFIQHVANSNGWQLPVHVGSEDVPACGYQTVVMCSWCQHDQQQLATSTQQCHRSHGKSSDIHDLQRWSESEFDQCWCQSEHQTKEEEEETI